MSREPDYSIASSFYGICEWCDYTTPEVPWRNQAVEAIEAHVSDLHAEDDS